MLWLEDNVFIVSVGCAIVLPILVEVSGDVQRCV